MWTTFGRPRANVVRILSSSRSIDSRIRAKFDRIRPNVVGSEPMLAGSVSNGRTPATIGRNRIKVDRR